MNTLPFTGSRVMTGAGPRTVERHAGRPEHHLHRRPRNRRLRRGGEVRQVFEQGHCVHARALSVYAVPTDGPTRTTVVAGRKVGGAVRRNRAKRRLRAALQASRLPQGFDVVVVARARCLTMPFADLRAQLAEQLRRSASGCAGT